MDPLVIVMVLTAAVLHVVWNAVVKVDDDRLMAMTVVIGTTGCLLLFCCFLGRTRRRELALHCRLGSVE